MSRAVGLFLTQAVVFGVAHTQAPLYYSNQNQYFLHGLAQAGVGDLDRDWLANTLDPTPVFTALVAFVARWLPEQTFYLIYVLVLGAYAQAMLALFDALGDRPNGLARLLFLTASTAIHAAILRVASVRLFGVDYPWYAQAGVAGQYVLGPALQPSVFGVGLIVSLAAVAHGRPGLAMLTTAATLWLHATYLLPALFLTLGHAYVCVREGQWRSAALIGLGTGALAAPVLVRHYVTFAPASAGVFAQAADILVHFRIPHHAVVERWLDGVAILQIVWVVWALAAIRGQRLFAVLMVGLLLAIVATLIQVGTGSDVLALLFPWRISVVLVPVATAILLGIPVRWLASWIAERPVHWQRRVVWLCYAVLAVLVVGGIAVHYCSWGYWVSTEPDGLFDHVRRHRRHGDLYLVPVEVPPRDRTSRGASSGTFLPPDHHQPRGPLPTGGMSSFRLATGAPIFVDFKSIPYKDVEVLEWYRRLRWAEERYEKNDWDREETVAGLTRRGLTHIVVPRTCVLSHPAYECVYDDPYYRVYRLRWVEVAWCDGPRPELGGGRQLTESIPPWEREASSR
ncbi:MAG: hypothetical protein NZ700_02230 [Gemmataceae bacterium]|nr:hypothetical protein [Gemmataceae bacterium]MDW8265288.1 DUF6798 domain-containing protein [Gemmataceae bacterium]